MVVNVLKKFKTTLSVLKLNVGYQGLGPNIHGLVTDNVIQVNVNIGNTLSRLSFQN